MQNKSIVLIALLVANICAADVWTSAGDQLVIDTTILQPYVATYSYHRPETAIEDGVHVTWKLEHDQPCGCWKNTITTHGDEQDYIDATDFDLGNLLLLGMRVPTQLEDRSLADVELTVSETKVEGTITPWSGSEAQYINNVITQRPMGAGVDLLMPTLALAPGLEVNWHGMNAEYTTKPISAVVLEQTFTTVNQENVPMWIVETDDGKGEFHIIRQPPYVLKRIFRPDGNEVFLVWDFRYSGPYRINN